MSRPLPADPDLARHMEAEARRTSGIRQDLAAPAGAPAGRMDVAAIIAGCLQPALDPADAETMAERIVAALDTAARAKPERQYAPGDVVQINPGVYLTGGSFLVVTKVMSRGVQGLAVLRFGVLSPEYVEFDRIEHTGGRAVWAPPVDTAGEGR